MNTTESDDFEHSASTGAAVALQTVGCKLNQAESESLASRFLALGYRLVSPEDNPDVYILNTCTVTHIADRKCRQYLRSFHRRNPEALILAIGCYAERDTFGLRHIEGVDLVLGNGDKDRVVEIIEGLIATKNTSNRGNGHHTLNAPLFRTRAMVKIQDGCSQSCSYCIVPQVRGRERSVPAEVVIEEIEDRSNRECKEVILTGTRIGAYDGEGGLEGLVQRILDNTAIPRIRLSSLQPREVTPSLLRLWGGNERMCRHLHLALQSGSDSVLKLMGRSYLIEDYEDTVRAVRNAMPDAAITTDIIVGFPGESDEVFEQSYRFCERMGFAGLHVFPYSARPGTPASRMPGRISDEIKKARSRAMIDLAGHSARNFRQRFSGRIMPVLWEEGKEGHLWIGHTDNYLKVFTTSDEPLGNCLVNTKLGNEHEDALWGMVENSVRQTEKCKRPVCQRRAGKND